VGAAIIAGTAIGISPTCLPVPQSLSSSTPSSQIPLPPSVYNKLHEIFQSLYTALVPSYDKTRPLPHRLRLLIRSVRCLTIQHDSCTEYLLIPRSLPAGLFFKQGYITMLEAVILTWMASSSTLKTVSCAPSSSCCANWASKSMSVPLRLFRHHLRLPLDDPESNLWSGFVCRQLIERANTLRETILREEGMKPIPGVLDLIRHLHASGIRLAVASSSPMTDILHTVSSFQVKDCFATFASGGECQNGKPFPDVFLLAAERLGVEPSTCLVIEDSRNGLLAAKAAGMTCIAFANPDYVAQDLKEADRVVTGFAGLTVADCRQLMAAD
jgi:HAD superfamily hydrolase (TIGR01509 family)